MFNRPQFAREMRRGEEAQVDALLRDAFGSSEEVTLVHALRKAGDIAGEQVLPMDGQIVGYYALSKMVQPSGWLCLAPVAIAPELQRQGHGRRMVGLLTEWARLTKIPIVVLGNPELYGQAGFSFENAQNLTSPYPIEFTGVAGLDRPANGRLVYPKAFGKT